MRWEVEWRPRALSDIAALEPQTRRRVSRALARVAEGGRSGLKKLQDRNADWRLRVGDWRVILTFDYPNNAITVWRVQHRREVYRER